VNTIDGSVSQLLVLGQGHRLIRLANVDQVVGDTSPLRRRGLGGTDIQTVIKQARISGNDLPLEFGRQLQ
jgi:hypothetical protein